MLVRPHLLVPVHGAHTQLVHHIDCDKFQDNTSKQDFADKLMNDEAANKQNSDTAHNFAKKGGKVAKWNCVAHYTTAYWHNSGCEFGVFVHVLLLPAQAREMHQIAYAPGMPTGILLQVRACSMYADNVM